MRSARALAALTLLCGLAACSDDGGEPEEEGANGGTSTSAAEPSGACTTEAPTGDDGLTEPGSYVCRGVPVEVTVAAYSDEARQGTAQITFTGAERAPEEVRDSLGDFGVAADQIEGRDLWYFTFEAEITAEISPGGLDGLDLFSFADGGPWTREGDIASTVIFQDLPGCPSEDVETEDGLPSGPVTFCRWWLVGQEDEVRGMDYSPVLLPEYEPIKGEPVRWSLSDTPAGSFSE